MIDWQKLKREVHIFIAALLLALLLAGTLLYLHQKTFSQWQQASNQLNQANNRYQVASDQKLLLAQYQQRFDLLKRNNVLGDEQRINWVEAIQASSTRHSIPSVKFSLEQRTDATLPDDVSNIAVYISKMNLEMNLLHEGDLFNLLADLDTRAEGLYGVKQCALKQESTGNVDNALSANITGNCELLWYTMSEPVEPQYDENGEPIVSEENYSDEGGE